MRNAINNNPIVQLGLLGALVLVAGLMLVPQFMHKSGSTAPTTTSSAQLSTPSGTVSVSVESSGGVPPAATAPAGAATSGSVPGSAGTVSPNALVPGRGLPRPVVSAWHQGNAIVLLIARDSGVDDRLVRGAVDGLSGDPGTSVFVVRAGHIARYSRITQGVGVSEVPALVVIRPRRLSGSVPQAQVTYGFRNSQSVLQQVHDALYSGKENLPYSPR